MKNLGEGAKGFFVSGLTPPLQKYKKPKTPTPNPISKNCRGTASRALFCGGSVGGVAIGRSSGATCRVVQLGGPGPLAMALDLNQTGKNIRNRGKIYENYGNFPAAVLNFC